MSSAIKLTSEITVRPIQSVGGDAMVVAAARVSTCGEEADKWRDAPAEDNYGLIRYLMRQRHGSPFEHGSMTFFVRAPIFVFREWHRHRVGFSYNEESARYKELEPVFWIPSRLRCMVPAAGFKPSRPQFVSATDEQYNRAVYQMSVAYDAAYIAYQNMIAEGVAREVARSVLPVGIYSSCWVTCNPRSLMHFLSLRTRDESAAHKSYPQAEIEEAARQCELMFSLGWPLTYKAFNECGRVAP